MARRAHRRDRRRPAPNTPGGTAAAIVAIRLLEVEDEFAQTLVVSRTNAGGVSPGYNPVELVGSENQAVAGITIFEGATKIPVTAVFVDANGEFSVETTVPRTGTGVLIIDPFLPFLATKSGAVCGGCIIDLPAPP